MGLILAKEEKGKLGFMEKEAGHPCSIPPAVWGPALWLCFRLASNSQLFTCLCPAEC